MHVMMFFVLKQLLFHVFQELDKVMPQSAYQTGDDIANAIVKCLNEKEPKVRCPTSEYGQGNMQMKFVDGVGQTGVDKWCELMPIMKS